MDVINSDGKKIIAHSIFFSSGSEKNSVRMFDPRQEFIFFDQICLLLLTFLTSLTIIFVNVIFVLMIQQIYSK